MKEFCVVKNTSPCLLPCITWPLQGWIDLAIYTEEVQTAEVAGEEAEAGKVGVGIVLGLLESAASAWMVSVLGVTWGTLWSFTLGTKQARQILRMVVTPLLPKHRERVFNTKCRGAETRTAEPLPRRGHVGHRFGNWNQKAVAAPTLPASQSVDIP